MRDSAQNPSPDCDEARSLIQEGLDRRLSPEEQGRIEAHAVGCEACGDHRDELLELREKLREMPATVFPPDALEAVWRHARALDDSAPRTHRRLFEWKPLAAAAVLVLAVLGYQLAYPPGSSGISQAEYEQAATDVRLVLNVVSQAVGRVERAAMDDVLTVRVSPALRHLRDPWIEIRSLFGRSSDHDYAQE